MPTREDRKKAYRYFLHKIATAKDLEEIKLNEMWAMSCIDNMKDITDKDTADMRVTVNVFTRKSMKRFGGS